MTEADILKHRSNIVSLIKDAKLYEAFSSFGTLLNSNPNWDINEELSKLQMSYKYMLTYMANGSSDPQKEHIYTGLLLSMYDLLDRYCHKILSRYSHSLYYALTQDFSTVKTTLKGLCDIFYEEYEKYMKEHLTRAEKDYLDVINKEIREIEKNT